MSLKDKANSLTFDYLTTSRTDYQVYDLKATPKTVLKENKQTKPVNVEKKREPRIKYTQTLKEWQSVPFDLLIGPKPILQTNPHHIQPPFKKPPDSREDEVRRTRPRLIISPAVVVDDVEDKITRNILMESTYTSESRKAFQFARDHPEVKAPLSEKYAPPRVVELPKLAPPAIAPEWRMDSMKWERKQLRSHCEPTMHFWTKRRQYCKP
ncbi:PREDICTED: uncharacterized protein LOC106099543 [Papilio polytes]|uniref:uncharacterized protein LOC106099543 n=1 Tax=Papilio polytes TaxID=76194 RepID=UPI0006764C03|nr:PREDICTED: uncharacterized protein LOC106099543 [Papilio polytes]